MANTLESSAPEPAGEEHRPDGKPEGDGKESASGSSAAPESTAQTTAHAGSPPGGEEGTDGQPVPALDLGKFPGPVTEDADTFLLPFPTVALGGSAGGLEATLQLLKSLPPDTGMAFVVLSHLAPAQKSHLVEILSGSTAMPVSPVEDQVVPEPNHIYVLPPNTFASFSQGRFRLEPRPEHIKVPMPIDHFFRTLAADQKNRAIGVILSGSDSDGALGLKAIKGQGGIAIVQTPESARNPGMPRHSLAADHVDLVLSPSEIGLELARLAKELVHPVLPVAEEAKEPAPSEEKQFQRIMMMLISVAGVDFRLYKRATLQRRILRRMVLSHKASLKEYAQVLQSHPDELRDLHEDVLINVTEFFRDPDVFEALKRTILSRILDNRLADQQVRIWVPGCSSGEEVYSIAMCLLELMGARGVDLPIQIFGTDASERLVQTARQGAYPESITGDVSPDRLRRFFVKMEKGYQVSKRLRDCCIFARQNVCSDPPFSRLDVVSCRNVLIYFTSALQRQVITTFHYALRPSGFLVLGGSEALLDFTDLFTLIDRKNKFYFKVPVSTTGVELYREDLSSRVESLPAETMRNEEKAWTEADLQRATDRIILTRYSPAAVVINEQLEILLSRGHTGPYLEMPPGSPSLQLTRMLRESIAGTVIDSVHRAIDKDLPVRVEDISLRDADHSIDLAVEVVPLQSVATRPHCYLVLFLPSPRKSAGPNADGEVSGQVAPEQRDQLIRELQKELNSSKLSLQSLIEERDVKNQDLTAANEEIQSANEELQSANEELETTKEEVQSANEELQTLNDELQERNSVLTQTSNDLNNLLISVNIPLLILNSNLEIRQYTALIQKIINVRPSDIGRPMNEIRHTLQLDDLGPIVHDVLENMQSRELEVQDKEGHWYLMRVRPYRKIGRASCRERV